MTAPVNHMYRLLTYRGLLERMARSLSIDLEMAMMDGHIDQSQIERLKLRCDLCDQPESCSRLLLARPNMEAAPDFCVNSTSLAELRRRSTNVC